MGEKRGAFLLRILASVVVTSSIELIVTLGTCSTCGRSHARSFPDGHTRDRCGTSAQRLRCQGFNYRTIWIVSIGIPLYRYGTLARVHPNPLQPRPFECFSSPF